MIWLIIAASLVMLMFTIIDGVHNRWRFSTALLFGMILFVLGLMALAASFALGAGDEPLLPLSDDGDAEVGL